MTKLKREMGKYLRNCKGIEEIAVMDVAQVGVRTRAQALAMAPAESSGPAKRRKVGGGELEMFQLKNRRQLLENSGNSTASNDQYSSPSSDHFLASCCSSNGSSEVSNEKLNFTDLEVYN